MSLFEKVTTCTVSTHCDICGGSGYTERLLEDYSTKEIGFVCLDCLSEVNEQLWKIRALQFSWTGKMLKIFMCRKRMKFTRAKGG